MSIFDSCLPEPGKCSRKPLIAFPDQPSGREWADIKAVDVTVKFRGYPTSID